MNARIADWKIVGGAFLTTFLAGFAVYAFLQRYALASTITPIQATVQRHGDNIAVLQDAVNEIRKTQKQELDEIIRISIATGARPYPSAEEIATGAWLHPPKKAKP